MWEWTVDWELGCGGCEFSLSATLALLSQAGQVQGRTSHPTWRRELFAKLLGANKKRYNVLAVNSLYLLLRHPYLRMAAICLWNFFLEVRQLPGWVEMRKRCGILASSQSHFQPGFTDLHFTSSLQHRQMMPASEDLKFQGACLLAFQVSLLLA